MEDRTTEEILKEITKNYKILFAEMQENPSLTITAALQQEDEIIWRRQNPDRRDIYQKSNFDLTTLFGGAK